MNDALGSLWKWLGQMKLGTTSIGWSPNVSTDTRLRSCDTAVTTSLSSMASQMDGLNDASWPNRVMSVPCRVVTTGRRCPCLAKIRRHSTPHSRGGWRSARAASRAHRPWPPPPFWTSKPVRRAGSRRAGTWTPPPRGRTRGGETTPSARLRVRDEMHLVPLVGQGLAELRRHHAAPAVGGVADDSNASGAAVMAQKRLVAPKCSSTTR